MAIKVTPITFTIRGYENDIDVSRPLYELREIPHKFVCTVQIIESTAYITAFMGELTLSDRKELSEILRDQYGVTQAEWRRKDKLINKEK